MPFDAAEARQQAWPGTGALHTTLTDSPSRNVAKWISSSLSPAQGLAENKASSPDSSKPPGIPATLMLYRVPEKKGKEKKKKRKKSCQAAPLRLEEPRRAELAGGRRQRCILTAFALQSDDTIPCPGRSPNPSEQTSGPTASFYEAPTAGILPPQKPSARATRSLEEKSQWAPGWATRMTSEDSVKPCGRGGDATAATACGSARHRASTGACGGQQWICAPRGTEASILCRAAVRAAASACGWQRVLKQRQVWAACPQSIPKTSGIALQSYIGCHSRRQAGAAATCLSQWEAVDGDLTESSLPKTRLCHLTLLCPVTPGCGHPLFTIPQPQHLQHLC